VFLFQAGGADELRDWMADIAEVGLFFSDSRFAGRGVR
jgi:hypothetical protein